MIFPRGMKLDGQLRGSPPRYLNGIEGWARGGTLYRSQLSKTIDAEGNVIEKGLAEVLDHLPYDYHIAYDIEKHGYNDRPKQGETDRQINYILAAKKLRPDCKHGFYSAFCHQMNPLIFPVGPRREAFSQWEDASAELAVVVDFIAPRVYVGFEGMLSRSNGVQPFIMKHWEDGTHYGLDEWKSWYDWILGMCQRWHRPVFPYVAPYSLQNDSNGSYDDESLEWAVTFFDSMIDYVLATADGVFFFDRSSATYDGQSGVTEEMIAAKLQRCLTGSKD